MSESELHQESIEEMKDNNNDNYQNMNRNNSMNYNQNPNQQNHNMQNMNNNNMYNYNHNQSRNIPSNSNINNNNQQQYNQQNMQRQMQMQPQYQQQNQNAYGLNNSNTSIAYNAANTSPPMNTQSYNQQNHRNSRPSQRQNQGHSMNRNQYHQMNRHNRSVSQPQLYAQKHQQKQSMNLKMSDNVNNNAIIHEREQTNTAFLMNQINSINTQRRKKSHIEKESWFYKKSRHMKQWRNRWTLINYDANTRNYMLCTYKNKIKLNNPTETMIIDEWTQIKFEKNEASDAKSYGIYLLTIKTASTSSLSSASSPRKNKNKTAELLEFRTGNYELGMNWLNAINTIIHLSQMRKTNLTIIPNYINDNKLIFIIYGYLHFISYNFKKRTSISDNIISVIFHFAKYKEIEFKLSPS